MSDEKSGKKRSYTLSEKALQQRRAASLEAAKKSTGPVTEEGKAASSRNNWKDGEYSVFNREKQWMDYGLLSKPCKSTCRFHPCQAVERGDTQPGGDCKDQRVYMDAYMDIVEALKTGELEHVHAQRAHHLASASSVLHDLQGQIRTRGPLIDVPVINRNGEAVKIDGKPLTVPKVNPLLMTYVKMLASMGISFADEMLTPRAVQKVQDGEDAADAINDLFTRALSRAGGAPVRRNVIIDQRPED